jgi:hypothetical protein
MSAAEAFLSAKVAAEAAEAEIFPEHPDAMDQDREVSAETVSQAVLARLAQAAQLDLAARASRSLLLPSFALPFFFLSLCPSSLFTPMCSVGKAGLELEQAIPALETHLHLLHRDFALAPSLFPQLMGE